MRHGATPQPLKDSFNRRIDYLRLSITDRCNLKCRYCRTMADGQFYDERDLLTAEEMARFVSIAHGFGLKKVRITGGEPLVRKDVSAIVRIIKDIGIADLSLTTNGHLLARRAMELREAGLDRVNISLDTLRASRYRTITRGGNIHRVWDSIAEAEHSGLSPVKINVVPIRGFNDDELLDFASLSLKKNYHIRFIEFMPTRNNPYWKEEKCISAVEIMKRISPLGKIHKLPFRGRGPSRNYRIQGAVGIIGIISPLSDHFCGYCNRIRLTADGRIRPCLFSRHTIDISSPMRSGASDREIQALFVHSVRTKPQKHMLIEGQHVPDDLTTMSSIGG